MYEQIDTSKVATAKARLRRKIILQHKRRLRNVIACHIVDSNSTIRTTPAMSATNQNKTPLADITNSYLQHPTSTKRKKNPLLTIPPPQMIIKINHLPIGGLNFKIFKLTWQTSLQMSQQVHPIFRMCSIQLNSYWKFKYNTKKETNKCTYTWWSSHRSWIIR
jgi:hypothetical protein